MYKVHKRDGGQMFFHEVWEEDGVVIEHFGDVGEAGETVKHEIPERSDEDTVMESLMRPVVMKGFAEIEDEDLIRLNVEIEKSAQGDETDLARRHELEDRLDDLLGETGLGHCDGGETTGECMTVFCFVVDKLIAEEVVESEMGSWKDFRRVRLTVQKIY